MASFTKFVRPAKARPGRLTDRDLDIVEAVLRYRFCPVSQLIRLVGGNEDVTHRRLRRLWESQLLSRWAFPGIRYHSEFHYYIDNRTCLALLAEHRGLEVHDEMLEEIRNNRDKDYGNAAVRGQHMQLGFLQHALTISRMHFCIEMACRKSGGRVELQRLSQGGPLVGHKVDVPRVKASREGNNYFWQESGETERLPVEPDALFTLRFPDRPLDQQLVHFCYEGDRGTMTTTDILRKLRAYYHFIKKQQRHRESFGVHPIRAVLFETTTEERGRRLMQLVEHPLVCGNKRAGLFWFTISSLFADVQVSRKGSIPHYLEQPEILFDPIWALPDRSMHALSDLENSS